MKRWGWHRFPVTVSAVALALLCCTQTVGAQTASDSVRLPDLPDDPAITVRTLPCGIRCYFAVNPSYRGKADLRLVQKMDPESSVEELLSIARNRFSELDIRSVETAPSGTELFFARNGLAPTSDGYVRVRPGGISYAAEGLMTARPEDILDSTLFTFVRLAALSAAEGQPSSSSAFIICGDIHTETLWSKMKLISLSIPYVKGEVQKQKYDWTPPAEGSAKPSFEGGSAARVVSRFNMSRIPDKYMKTLLPVMTDKMTRELEWVLRNRLYPAFRANRLTVRIDFAYTSCAETSGDAGITLTVHCARSLRDKTRDILQKEIDRLYEEGVSMEEYCYARDSYKYDCMKKASAIVRPNREFAERCESAFFHGTPLSSGKQRLDVSYREIPDSIQTVHFNGFVKGLLRQAHTPSDSLSGRRTGTAAHYLLQSRKSIEDSLEAYRPQPGVISAKTLKKIKDDPEYITGGTMWMMPSGLNVIYKQMNTGGFAYLSLTSRGGRAGADPDFFSCIDGVPEESFTNYMTANGMDLHLRLDPVDVTVEGNVPEDKLEDGLLVLSALAGQKENALVYAPDNYKLLVVVSELPVSKAKALIYEYSRSFGDGGEWTADIPADSDDTENGEVSDSASPEADVIEMEMSAPMNVSSHNVALLDVTGHVLRYLTQLEFCGYAGRAFARWHIQTFPSGECNVIYGIELLPSKNFALSETTLPVPVANKLIQLVTKSPEISDDLLEYCKKETLDAFSIYSSSPEYYARTACDRYLNKKDFYSKYSESVDYVSKDAVIKFLASLRPSPNSSLNYENY